MSSLNEEIGKRIAALRKSNHMTQEALAEKLNISVKHCSCVERGVASLSLELFIELCDIFDTTLDYIIRGKDYSDIGNVPPFVIDFYQKSPADELPMLQEYMKMYQKLRESKKER